jgi:superfamily I DNA/RNA helicase
LVVADAAQNIYQNAFTWKAAGINALGRTRVLNVGYRNTREVLEFAHGFLMKGGDVRLDTGADTTDESAIIPPTLSVRHGPVPLFLRSESPQFECLAIAEHCAERIAKGSSPGSIAVLYGARWAGGFDWLTTLRTAFVRRGVPYCWATNPDDRNAKDTLGAAPDPERVVLSTIHSAKGLEWRHVVLVAIFDDRPESDRTLNRRLIYVGMTRATEELAISTSGRHRYLVDMER